MRTSDRHPVLEYLVFGLAGLLAVILAYYGFMRWENGRRAASPEAPLGRAADDAAPETPPAADADRGGFHGGGSVPMVRLSQPEKKPSR